MPTSTQALNTATITTSSIARSGSVTGFMSPDSSAIQVRPIMSLEGKNSIGSNTTNTQSRTTTSMPAPQSCQVTTTTSSQIQTKPVESVTMQVPQTSTARQTAHVCETSKFLLILIAFLY